MSNINNDGNLKISFQKVGSIEWKSQKEVDSQVEMKGEFTTADGRKFEVCVNYNKEQLKGPVGDTSAKVKEFFSKFEKDELKLLTGQTMTGSLKTKNIEFMKKEGVESKHQSDPQFSNVFKKANEIFQNVFFETENENEYEHEDNSKLGKEHENELEKEGFSINIQEENLNKDNFKPPSIKTNQNNTPSQENISNKQQTNFRSSPPLPPPSLTTNLQSLQNLPPPKHLQPPQPLNRSKPMQAIANQNINQKIGSSLLNTMPNLSPTTSNKTIDPELTKTMPSPPSVINKEKLTIDEKKAPEQLHGTFKINQNVKEHQLLKQQLIEMKKTEKTFHEGLKRLKTDLTELQNDSLKDELSLINDLESMSGTFATRISACIDEENNSIDADKLEALFTDGTCEQYLKKIGEYINNYDSFLEKLNAGGDDSIAKKIDTKRGMNDSSSVSEVMKQSAVDVVSDAITPVQRGPRYILYLNEFEKQVPGIAVSSQTKVSGYMKEMNENQRSKEMNEKLPKIMQEMNTFLHPGQAVKINQEGKLEASLKSGNSDDIGKRIMNLLTEVKKLNPGFASSFGKALLNKKDFRKFLRNNSTEKVIFQSHTGLDAKFVDEKLNASRKKTNRKTTEPPKSNTKKTFDNL